MKELNNVDLFTVETPGHADEFNRRQQQLMQRDEELRAELSLQNHQTAHLQHGLNIIESEQDSISDVTIQGRTMVNLWNHKAINYVIAGNEGEKYQGETSLYDTATFGKKNDANPAGHLQFRPSMEDRNRFAINFKNGCYYIVGAWLYIKSFKALFPTTLPCVTVRYIEEIGNTYKHGTSVTRLNEWYPSTVVFQCEEDFKGFLQPQMLHGEDTDMGIDGVFCYELTVEEYQAALTLSSVQRVEKYPYVDGVQHVRNPVITKKGDNLLSPYNSSIFTEPNTITIPATGSYDTSRVIIPVIPGEKISVSGVTKLNSSNVREMTVAVRFRETPTSPDISPSPSISLSPPSEGENEVSRTTTIPHNANYLVLFPWRGADYSGSDFEVKNIMVNYGDPKPYTPQKNDYMYCNVSLGSSLDGSVRDLIYKKDGKYAVREYLKKGFVLDGDVPNRVYWQESYTGFKRLKVDLGSAAKADGKVILVSDGGILYSDPKPAFPNDWKEYQVRVHGDSVRSTSFTVPNEVTGWPDDKNPTDAEVREFIRAHPHKITFELANPVEHELSFGGAISLHEGKNLLEFGEGVILHERIEPIQYNVPNSGSFYGINYIGLEGYKGPTSPLSNKVERIISIKKDGKDVTEAWQLVSGGNRGITSNAAYGNDYARIPATNYDPDATYTVTYIALDKHQLTTAIDKASISYQTSLKSAHAKTVQQVTDNKKDITQLDLMMGEIVKTLRQLKGV